MGTLTKPLLPDGWKPPVEATAVIPANGQHWITAKSHGEGFTVRAELPETDALSEWRRDAWAIGVGTGIVEACVLVAAIVLAGTRRRDELLAGFERDVGYLAGHGVELI